MWKCLQMWEVGVGGSEGDTCGGGDDCVLATEVQ